MAILTKEIIDWTQQFSTCCGSYWYNPKARTRINMLNPECLNNRLHENAYFRQKKQIKHCFKAGDVVARHMIIQHKQHHELHLVF